MEVTFTLTRRDCEEFNHWILLNVPSQRRRLMFEILGMAAICLYFWWQAGFNREVLFWGTLPCFVIAIPLVFWSFKLGMRRQVANMPWVLQPQTVRIDPKGYFGRTSLNEATTPWINIAKVVNTKNHLYFFLTDRIAMIVPKRAFDSDSEAQTFADMAVSYWNEARDSILAKGA